MNHKRFRISSVLLALVLVLGLALPAFAAPVPPNTTELLPLAENDGKSKITIHKYDIGDIDPGDLTVPGTGEEVAGNVDIGGGATLGSLTPLKDIEFLIEYYKYDGTDGSYTLVENATDWYAPPGAAFSFDNTLTFNSKTIYGYKGKTDGNGELFLENLGFGKYVVYEVDSQGNIGINDPFTVYVPTQLLTDPAAREWIYDIHVYPKNHAAGNFDKHLLTNSDERGEPVQGDDAHGNRFTWELEVELRGVGGGGNKSNMKWIKLVDKIAPYLQLDPNSIKVEYLKAGYTDNKAERMPLDVDYYEIDLPTSTNTNTLTVTLNATADGTGAKKDTGLNYLMGEDAVILILTITTYTTSGTSVNGPVKNYGTYEWEKWDGGGGDKETPDPDKSQTEVNDVVISKENPSGDELANVKFVLFKNNAAALAYDGDPAKLTDTNCVVSDLTQAGGLDRYTFTSGPDGKISIDNIESAFIKAGETNPSVFYSYWLVEIETIGNYNLLPGPILIDFSEHTLGVPVLITVINQEGFTLPHTGGSGTTLFTVLGLGLITIAGIVFILYRRRRNRETPHT